MKPHPFCWLLWLLSLPAIAGAVAARERTPGYALESPRLYRLEVGVAIFFGLIVVGLVFWRGHSGRSLGKIELPGGGGLDLPNPDPDLADAAEGFAGYSQRTDRRLEALERSICELTSTDEHERD